MAEQAALLTEVKKLLSQCDLTARQIADGAGVGYHWVRKVKYSSAHDFGARKLEKVHRYLTDYEAAKRFGMHQPREQSSVEPAA